MKHELTNAFSVARPHVSLRRALVRSAYGMLHKLHAAEILGRVLKGSLTVLVYHRIADPGAGGYVGFHDLASATRQAFAAQLDELKARRNVVSWDQVAAWHKGDCPLPERATLITFDDGYRDNFTTALPELEARNLPAVFFVTSGFIDREVWPWWDWIAEVFKRSARTSAHLPILGARAWRDGVEQRAVQRAFIDACKRVQKRELTRLMAELAASLEVDPNMPVPSGLMMSWDELRSAAKRGIAVGAHTVTHPMLTRVSCEEAYEEMARSKAIIESKLGLPVESFAYPSGSFTTAHESMARNADFCIAFAADGGATFASEVRARPYAVRRVCICMRDDLPRFAFKAAGLTRYSKLERAT